jgi:excisionase family DNA binding protein
MAMSVRTKVEQALLSVAETAVLYGVSEKAVWNWIYSREIPSVKVGRLRKLKKSDLEKYIEENTVPARKKVN